MKSILEKNRKLNRLLQMSAGVLIEFEDMAFVMCEILGCSVFILGENGKFLGYKFRPDFACADFIDKIDNLEKIPTDYNRHLHGIFETSENLSSEAEHKKSGLGNQCDLSGSYSTVIPIVGGGTRLGTLVVESSRKLDDYDLVIAEHGATVIGMEILKAQSIEKEKLSRKKAAVQIAINTLSFSEKEAVVEIFRELDGNEGILVASKIADRAMITRSVIVNALRKFESAGVIKSKSLGMKGTYIKILNEYLLDELLNNS